MQDNAHTARAARSRLSPLDQLLIAADSVLRASFGEPARGSKPSPADQRPEGDMDDAARLHASRLMRVNHSGEVAAQALYEGQALTARERQVRRALRRAAREEYDHLAWCADRVRELGGRPSALNLLWYTGSYAIGALTG